MRFKDNKTRSVFDIALTSAAIFFYIWVLERSEAPDWLRGGFFWGVCVGFPVYCIAREQKAFPEFSLDWGNFRRSLRGTVWFTLAATLGFVAISFRFKSFYYEGNFLTRVSEYFFWAFLQQIGMQTFLTYRVAQAVPGQRRAAFLSATLFALFHLPNAALMVFSWVGGMFWSYSYLRWPNLYALAISHGWLAVVALHCVPASWLHGLRVGPTYWSF